MMNNLNNNEEKPTCPICLDELTNAKVILHCNHALCLDCYTNLTLINFNHRSYGDRETFNKKHHCPLCRDLIIKDNEEERRLQEERKRAEEQRRERRRERLQARRQGRRERRQREIEHARRLREQAENDTEILGQIPDDEPAIMLEEINRRVYREREREEEQAENERRQREQAENDTEILGQIPDEELARMLEEINRVYGEQERAEEQEEQEREARIINNNRMIRQYGNARNCYDAVLRTIQYLSDGVNNNLGLRNDIYYSIDVINTANEFLGYTYSIQTIKAKLRQLFRDNKLIRERFGRAFSYGLNRNQE